MVDYSTYQHLLVEKKDGVALMTMNRPEVLNATNFRLHNELSRIWLDLGADPEVRAAVITGSGNALTSADGKTPMSPLPLAALQRQVRIHLVPPRTICLADAAFSLSVFLPHDLDECHTRDFRKLRALSQMVNVNHQWFA